MLQMGHPAEPAPTRDQTQAQPLQLSASLLQPLLAVQLQQWMQPQPQMRPKQQPKQQTQQQTQPAALALRLAAMPLTPHS
jgi:hypothetical protein